MGRVDSVCLSSDGADEASLAEDQESQLYCDASSASLAEPSVVYRPTGISGRVTIRTSNSETVTQATIKPGVSLKPSNDEPSRVAFIEQSLVTRGFSAEVAGYAAKGQRDSTLALYQSRFKQFSTWCSERDISLESVTPALVADYLVYLFEVKKLGISAIGGHRSALSGPFGVMEGYTLGSHPVLSIRLNLQGSTR